MLHFLPTSFRRKIRLMAWTPPQSSLDPCLGYHDRTRLSGRLGEHPIIQAMATRQPGRREFASVQALRGMAALAVCWFHFTYDTGSIPRGWLSASGTYGRLGVDAFF